MQIVKRLDEVLRAPAPSAELGDQYSVDLAGSGHRQDLGALGARVASARRRLLEHRHDLVARTLCEGPKIPFLRSHDWSSVETRQ